MSWFDTLNAEAEQRLAVNPNRPLMPEERLKRYLAKLAPSFSDDFLQGQKDCEKGEPAKEDGSEGYQRGFAAQYQHEQNMSELSK